MSRILEGRGIILQPTITIMWIQMNPQGPRRILWGVQPLPSSGWKGFLIFFPHPCTDFNTGLNSCCGHLSGDTHVCLYQHQNICFFVVFLSITKYRVAEVVSSWFLIELIWLNLQSSDSFTSMQIGAPKTFLGRFANCMVWNRCSTSMAQRPLCCCLPEHQLL